MQCQRVALGLAIVLGAATCGVLASVPCNHGFIEFECPNDYPQCCAWENNGVVAACCPESSQCSLDTGECIVNTNVRNRTSLDPKGQSGITVDVSEAAAFITFAAIGFIVALVACAFLAFKTFVSVDRRRTRRREEERQRLLSEGDDEVRAAADDDDSEVDDEGQCNICFSRHVNCVLMPCAHVCTCRACAERLDKCPICREDVQRTIAFKTKLYRPPNTDAAGSKRRKAADAAGGARLSARSEELGASPRPAGAAAAPAAETSAAEPGTPAAVATTVNDAGAASMPATSAAAAPPNGFGDSQPLQTTTDDASTTASASTSDATSSSSSASSSNADTPREARVQFP